MSPLLTLILYVLCYFAIGQILAYLYARYIDHDPETQFHGMVVLCLGWPIATIVITIVLVQYKIIDWIRRK